MNSGRSSLGQAGFFSSQLLRSGRDPGARRARGIHTAGNHAALESHARTILSLRPSGPGVWPRAAGKLSKFDI